MLKPIGPLMTGRDIKIRVWKHRGIWPIIIGLYAICGVLMDYHRRAHRCIAAEWNTVTEPLHQVLVMYKWQACGQGQNKLRGGGVGVGEVFMSSGCQPPDLVCSNK